MDAQHIAQQDDEQQIGLPPALYMERANLFDKMKPESVNEYLKLRLQGYTQDQSGNWIREEGAETLSLSKVGATELSNLATSVLTKTLTITNLNYEEIRTRQYNLAKAILAKCLAYWQEYNITSTAQIRAIFNILVSQTFLAFKEAENAGARNLIRGVTQEQLVTMQGSQYQQRPQKPSFLGRIFGRV